jgi:DNA-binding HxlR family transcriptional regulator
MAIDHDKFTATITVLTHPLRRDILVALKIYGCLSFTEMLRGFNVDTGKLSFHLRHLKGYIGRGRYGEYLLTEKGLKLVELLYAIDEFSKKTYSEDIKSGGILNFGENLRCL